MGGLVVMDKLTIEMKIISFFIRKTVFLFYEKE